MKLDVAFYEEWVEWTGNKAAKLLTRNDVTRFPEFAREVAGVTQAVARAARNPLAWFTDPLKPARTAIQVMKEKWGA